MNTRGKFNWRTAALAAAAAVPLVAGTAMTAAADTITLRIESLRAIDKLDPLGQADFFARVTIDGQVFQTKRIRRADVVHPNWEFPHQTNKRSVDVKIEIFDKDILTPSDLIDINRVDNKRDLDFRVTNERRCRVIGFADDYRCRDKVIRAGRERKAAEITFSVHHSR